MRFIVTDTRSERDPHVLPDSPAKTVLGAAQKIWFQQELLEASGVYPVIVWVNTFPWIGAKGDDGWYAYTYERTEIADFIKDNGIEGLYMISGDAHMLAIDDGSNSDYATGGGAPIPVMHAASMDQGGSVKGGPYSEGAFPGGGQFGLMTIQDDGVSPVCIVWSGRNASNVEVVGWSHCDAAAPPTDADGDGVADVVGLRLRGSRDVGPAGHGGRHSRSIAPVRPTWAFRSRARTLLPDHRRATTSSRAA